MALAVTGRAFAHEASGPVPTPAPAQVRGGLLIGVTLPWNRAAAFPERGTGDLNAEFISPAIFHSSRLPGFLLPRLRAGLTVNLAGRTSFADAGVLWHYRYTSRSFAELFFGGLVHNGQLRRHNPGLAVLGCRVLYEVGVNFGYRLGSRYSVMLTFDHGSNGSPVLSSCARNEGIDLLGLRFGVAF